jgi:hypothetical protein
VAGVEGVDRGHVVGPELEAEDVDVLGDAGRLGRLGDDRAPVLQAPAQQHLSGALAVGLGAAILLVALIPIAPRIDALAALAAGNLVLWSIIGYETFYVYDERRYRLRHGLDIDVPGSS